MQVNLQQTRAACVISVHITMLVLWGLHHQRCRLRPEVDISRQKLVHALSHLGIDPVSAVTWCACAVESRSKIRWNQASLSIRKVREVLSGHHAVTWLPRACAVAFSICKWGGHVTQYCALIGWKGWVARRVRRNPLGDLEGDYSESAPSQYSKLVMTHTNGLILDR